MLAVRKLQRDDGLTLPQIKEALRGQNSEGRVDAAAFRNLEALVAARVGMDGEVLLETLTAAWPYAEHDAKVSVSRRSEEHTSELPSLMRTSYAVLCLTKKPHIKMQITTPTL